MNRRPIKDEDSQGFAADFGTVLAAAVAENEECPAADSLLDFAEGRLEGQARDAVAAHLELCADCSELVARAAAGPAELDEVTWARAARGLDRRLAETGAPWRSAPRRPGVAWRWAAGVAAALLVAVVLPVGLARLDRGATPPDTPVAVQRGAPLQPREPAGTVASVHRFAWSAPPADLVFRVELAEEEVVLWSAPAEASPWRPPGQLLEALAPGRDYRWRVVGLDRDGRELFTSRWAGFTLVPPPNDGGE